MYRDSFTVSMNRLTQYLWLGACFLSSSVVLAYLTAAYHWLLVWFFIDLGLFFIWYAGLLAIVGFVDMEKVDLVDQKAAEDKLIYKHSTRGRWARKFYYWRIGPKKRFIRYGILIGILVAGLIGLLVWLI
jgi:hypothetical protein